VIYGCDPYITLASHLNHPFIDYGRNRDGKDTDNRKAASGGYFYRLETDKTSITKKYLMLR